MQVTPPAQPALPLAAGHVNKVTSTPFIRAGACVPADQLRQPGGRFQSSRLPGPSRRPAAIDLSYLIPAQTTSEFPALLTGKHRAVNLNSHARPAACECGFISSTGP